MKVGDGITQINFNSSIKPAYDKVGFKGGLKAIASEDELVKTFLKNNSKFGALTNWFNKCAGEKTSIIINAIGTGLLAPLVIANNPLSKEDKDVKTYSALRQPISAVIAIITQLAVCMKADKIIDRLAYNNKLGTESQKNAHFYDLSVIKNAKENSPLKNKFNGLKDSEILKTLHSAGEITKNQFDKVSNAMTRLKAFKNWTGIGLSLVTLPFACCALNWIYPRFMEKFFPEISNAKKLKEE
ncbi:MAG: hypothetical protein PHC34_03435 [Candidatus Gastranaerophilales bacterium]|nr:hypothetical protein [Candidatus Gastranaerophilales bacterium]